MTAKTSKTAKTAKRRPPPIVVGRPLTTAEIEAESSLDDLEVTVDRPHILATTERLEKYERALKRINEVRNSIVGFQTVNWSEHVYPLAAALTEAGFEGLPYPEARRNVETVVEQLRTAKGKVAMFELDVSRQERVIRAAFDRAEKVEAEIAVVKAERDDARCKLEEISALVGPGGDDTAFGRVESMLNCHAIDADRLKAVRALLVKSGCDCECGHDAIGHDDTCELCFACQVQDAISAPPRCDPPSTKNIDLALGSHPNG